MTGKDKLVWISVSRLRQEDLDDVGVEIEKATGEPMGTRDEIIAYLIHEWRRTEEKYRQGNDGSGVSDASER